MDAIQQNIAMEINLEFIKLRGIKGFLEASKSIDYDDETLFVPYYTIQMKRKIHERKWKGSLLAHIVEN